MILNNIFALTFIPSLINYQTNETFHNSTTTANDQFSLDSAEHFLNDLKLLSDHADTERELSTKVSARNSGVSDPLIDEINAEIERLHLEFPDDYFDHLEDKSEEIRHLIHSRRQSADAADRQRRSHDDNSGKEGRSIKDVEDDVPSTIVPILTPPTTTEIPEPPSSTTKKPKGFFGSAVSSVHNEATSIFKTITSPISGARGLFSWKQTPSPTPAELVVSSLNCTDVQAEYNGQCYNLLQQFPCGEKQWLVEDESTVKGKCVENECHDKSGTALFGKVCIKVGSDKDCQRGMRTYVFRSGKVECDCKDGHIYYAKDGNCYKPYTQGPCQVGQHFIMPKSGRVSAANQPTCMPNPCIEDGSFCNAPRCPKRRNCEKLGNQCGTNGKYVIHPQSNVPFCHEADQKLPDPIIGNVPTLSCAPGSRRDILGNCRTPTNINFS